MRRTGSPVPPGSDPGTWPETWPAKGEVPAVGQIFWCNGFSGAITFIAHANFPTSRETSYHKNAKQGTERVFDEEGIVIDQIQYADGRVASRRETFEAEDENDVGRKFLINFNPLPLVLSAIVEKGLAIPAAPFELGYRVSGYTGLMLAPAVVLNGAGGWGITGGLAIADVPGSWIGNMFAVRFGYFDISEFGSDWNVAGSFYHNYALAKGWLWFWGVNVGWGLNGIEITKSTDTFTGESRVESRSLDDGLILGLNGGFGFDF